MGYLGGASLVQGGLCSLAGPKGVEETYRWKRKKQRV